MPELHIDLAPVDWRRARVNTHVRGIGATLNEDQRDEVARKVGAKLGKFAAAIERASVRVTDVNGPRGGVDQRCRIKVVLSGLPSVVVERQDARREAVIESAIGAASESVRRVVGRRRMKPLHRRGSKTPA